MTRHGNHIRIRPGVTAIEGCDRGLPSLEIRKDGKTVKRYRGSSLVFSKRLTADDKDYLEALAKGI